MSTLSPAGFPVPTTEPGTQMDGGQAGGGTDGQAERGTDRWTGRWRDRQMSRQLGGWMQGQRQVFQAPAFACAVPSGLSLPLPVSPPQSASQAPLCSECAEGSLASASSRRGPAGWLSAAEALITRTAAMSVVLRTPAALPGLGLSPESCRCPHLTRPAWRTGREGLPEPCAVGWSVSPSV